MSMMDAIKSDADKVPSECAPVGKQKLDAHSQRDEHMESVAFNAPLVQNESVNEGKSKVDPALPGYELKITMEAHQWGTSAVRFSPRGDCLASGSADRLVKLWDLSTGQLVRSLPGHQLGINDVNWSPHDKFLISCSDDKTLKLWDVRSGSMPIMTIYGHQDHVFACSVNPQSNLIASSSLDCTVRLWDTRAGRCLKVVPAHMDRISSVDFNRDGSLFVTCSFDGLVRIWDTISGQVQKTLIDDDNSPVGCVKFAPNGRYILVGYLNSQIKLWSFHKPKCLRIYKGHTNLKYCITVNFSVTAGMWIVAGSEDGFLYLWSLQSKKLVQKVKAHNQVLLCSDCHPTRNMIATGALEATGNLKVWQSQELNNEPNN